MPLTRRVIRASTLLILLFALGCADEPSLGPCPAASTSAARREAAGGIEPWRAVVYTLPAETPEAHDIAIGADGELWYADTRNSCIGRLSAATGQVEAFATLTSDAGPHGLAVDPQGKVWYAATRAGRIGRVDPEAGRIREYQLPAGVKDPHGIIAHPAGIWFTAPRSNRYGRLDPLTGRVDVYDPGLSGSSPYSIAAGPDGSVWIGLSNTNLLHRMRAGAEPEEVPLPDGARPLHLTLGDGGSIWYTDRYRSVLGVLEEPRGQAREFPTHSRRASPRSVAAGADGIWYFEERTGLLVMFDPDSGETTALPLGDSYGPVREILSDPSTSRLWVALSRGAIIGLMLP